MNKTAKYATWGLWIFVFIVVVAFAIIYASQTARVILLYAGVALEIVFSLVLLVFLLQNKQSFNELEQEINRLEQREQARLREEDRKKSEQAAETQADNFNADEILAKIMPNAETTFTDAQKYTEKILQNTAKELDIVQGLVFLLDKKDQLFNVSGEYAYYSEEQPRSFPLGETLSGQVAKNKQLLNVQEMPEGYITVLSGLGKSSPRHLIIAPFVHDDESIGVIELASFKPFGKNEEVLIEKMTGAMAGKLNELRK